MPRLSEFRQRLLERALELESRSLLLAIPVQTLVGFALLLKLMPPRPAGAQVAVTAATVALATALLLVGLVWIVAPVLGQVVTFMRQGNVGSGSVAFYGGILVLTVLRESGKRYLAAMRPCADA